MKRDIQKSVTHSAVNGLIRLEARVSGLKSYDVNLGEMTMSYYSNGDKQDRRPVLLLLHGFSADKSAWSRFAKHFTRNFRVVIPDMPGHGDTGFVQGWHYSAPHFAETIKRFLDRLSIQQVHVVGNSLGGFVSAYFAWLYPESTLSATVVNPTGVAGSKPSTMDLMVAKGDVPFYISSRGDFDRFWSMIMAKPPWVPELALKVLCEQYMSRKPELVQIFSDYHGKDFLEEKLGEIRVPMLQLWGAKDQIVDASCADVWAAGVPNMQTRVWQDIGHMPMVEIPWESAQVVSRFIENLQEGWKHR